MKNSDKLIRNIDFPSCRNCRFYQVSKFSNNFTDRYNRCTKFGEKDVVTDKIDYDFADSCRKYDDKCGKEGRYFEKEPRMFLKILKHKALRPVNLLWVVSIMYLTGYYIRFLL